MNPDPILFPDAVLDALGPYLQVLLDVPVVRSIPNPRPDSFVVLKRVGGARETIVSDRPRVAYETFAADETAAARLAQLVRTHVLAMKGHQVPDYGPVYRVDEVGGPVPLPDPLTGLPRYTGSALIHLRGAPYAPVTSE